jgi:serine/threonine protein phosphatase 1
MVSLNALGRLFRPAAPEETRPIVGTAAVPALQRFYVVGDIHGRLDLLSQLFAAIDRDRSEGPPSLRSSLVLLGDYVDRGPQSREVIDLILERRRTEPSLVALAGNHERVMLDFMREPEAHCSWLLYGGIQTLQSYGVAFVEDDPSSAQLRRYARFLTERLPDSHRRFLEEELVASHGAGDYFFAHAGIDPAVPLAEQRSETLYWIREPFLRAKQPFEKVVVHGHTITPEPDVRKNRIGIDTGAYHSGVLTCLVLEGRSLRWLRTGHGTASR